MAHGKYGVLTAKFGWNNVTVEYWKNKSDAEEALINGNWTQREDN